MLLDSQEESVDESRELVGIQAVSYKNERIASSFRGFLRWSDGAQEVDRKDFAEEPHHSSEVDGKSL